MLNKKVFTYSLVLVFSFFSMQIGDSFAKEFIFNNSEEYLDIFGSSAQEQFGTKLLKTDINADGVDDLVVSSPFYSAGLNEWNGKVSVFFGGDKSLDTPDLVFYGKDSGNQLSMSLASGDLNNDGIDDIAIGEHNSLVEEKRPGKVYIYYGSKEINKKSVILDESFEGDTLVGENDGDAFGLNVEIKDIHNDGSNDLIVSSPFYDSEEIEDIGRVYIYLDANFKEFKTIDGFKSNTMFGADVEIGNLDLDTENELLISAYKANNSTGSEVGEIYIFDDFSRLKENFNGYDNILVGKNPYDWFGFTVKVLDIDSDGLNELIVSTFPYSMSYGNGRIEVYKLGDNLWDIDYDTEFSDEDSDLIIGADFILANLDKNEKSDLLINAVNINPAKTSNLGLVYAFYNGEFNNYSLENESQLKINSGPGDDWFSYGIETLDFNNDSFTDIAISSRYADTSNSPNSGKVSIIYGDEDGIGKNYSNFSKIAYDEEIQRGEFVKYIVEEFDLKEKNEGLIQNCYDYKDFCFFEFSGKSSFDGLSVDPEILLYPDVDPSDDYYEAVNIATILGIINGYMEAPQSPFMPEESISRIQALKVVLGANKLVDYKYQFELEDLLGSFKAIFEQASYYKDIDPNISHMWWYPRYVNFAYEAGIIDDNENFRPDDAISVDELDIMIKNTKLYLENIDNEEI